MGCHRREQVGSGMALYARLQQRLTVPCM